jgi:hypothetical protein
MLHIRTSVSLFDLHGFNTADQLVKIFTTTRAYQQNTHYTTKTKNLVSDNNKIGHV